MIRRILILSCVLFGLFSAITFASDLGHSIMGADVVDELGKNDKPGKSPYIIEGDSSDAVEKQKPQGSDYHFSPQPEVSIKDDPRKEYSDIGYTLPGTFEKQENYIELDKAKMAKGYRRLSTGGITFSFINNSFDYKSTNDVVNRTISTGAKSVKGGLLLFRHDDYLSRASLVNTYWSAGIGLGFNSGKAFFIDGSRSNSTFNLWELPLDLGLGLEIPLTSWFKMAGTAGPSAMALIQNRSDYQRGEEGKRKFQYSPGYFASAQFKINMSGLSDQTAYELFTESQITNLFLNLEARHQSYSNFQDPVEITGTSFGIGFTFEYL